MTFLSLGCNELTGRLIHNFIQWSWRRFSLSNKTVVKQFTISFFTVLSWLCIGPIPPEIIKLTKLEILYADNNQLTGWYFHNFTSNKILVQWFIIHCFHSFVLTLYRTDSARNCRISTFAGPWFTKQHADRSINSHHYIKWSVSRISTSNKTVMNQFFISFCSLFFLSWLSLGQIPSEIFKLTNLQKLYLYQNQLTGR